MKQCHDPIFSNVIDWVVASLHHDVIENKSPDWHLLTLKLECFPKTPRTPFNKYADPKRASSKIQCWVFDRSVLSYLDI